MTFDLFTLAIHANPDSTLLVLFIASRQFVYPLMTKEPPFYPATVAHCIRATACNCPFATPAGIHSVTRLSAICLSSLTRQTAVSVSSAKCALSQALLGH